MIGTIETNKTEANFFADIIAAIDGAKVKPAVMPQAQPATLTERLNSMIAVGTSFDISADDFQVTGAEFLSSAETAFFYANKSEVLCTLQQSALMKYLSPSDLQMFVDEVKERAAILSDGKSGEPPFEILNEIVREWFADMLEEMPK